ncbi:hypothetical protein UlMin_045084 [Ulmus minor]
MFGSDEEVGNQVMVLFLGVSHQVPTLVEGSRSVLISKYKHVPNPSSIGFFGTQNMRFMCQKNHIYTSGASGTNATFIKGALRAEKPELFTVILPQRLKKQSPKSQELLSKNVIEKPHNDHLTSRLCKMDIISHVQRVICFSFRDSRMLMETCQEAKILQKIITLFYLDLQD